jgi:hypothetical protein
MATRNCTTVLVDQHTATPTHHFATYLEQRAGEDHYTTNRSESQALFTQKKGTFVPFLCLVL